MPKKLLLRTFSIRILAEFAYAKPVPKIKVFKCHQRKLRERLGSKDY